MGCEIALLSYSEEPDADIALAYILELKFLEIGS